MAAAQAEMDEIETGTPAMFVHPGEASHGDMGMITAQDAVLALSNSGSTAEVLTLLPLLKRLSVPLVSMTGNPQSELATAAQAHLDASVSEEACPLGLAPTASTTCALALGDALAMALSEKKGFKIEEYARLHPGGKLGKKLAYVRDLMHQGDQLPVVSVQTPMEDVIYEMSSKGLGMAAVVEGDLLKGVISDGDLRRLLQSRRSALLDQTAGECMTRQPVTISQDVLAVEALNRMEKRKITSLMVTDTEGKLLGIIHLHDLWGTEIF